MTNETVKNLAESHHDELSKLAPFRDPELLTPSEQLGLVNELSEYIEDPTTARYLDKRRHDIHDGMPDGWDPDYETYLNGSTRDSLEKIATTGKTFIAQELSRGLVASPLARVFDSRPGLSMGNRIERGAQIFADAERQLSGQGYLSEGALENDEIFLANKLHRNFVAMQGRMWHMAYEMPEEAVKRRIEPFAFEMRAYGSISTNNVPDEFHDKFVSQQPIDYNNIIDAGLQYVPVQTSADSIGFYEESGRLVHLFGLTDNLKPGDKAITIDIEDRIKNMLVNASDDDVLETAQAHYMLAGNLQVRNILETSLDVRFDTLSLDEQILLCKLLMRATPAQMRSVAEQGTTTLINVARSLEFGSDHGDSILTIAEHATSDQSKEIFETVNRFRESAEKIARWYESYDPKLAHNYELAINERMTDALAALEVLARDGRLEVDVSPRQNSEGYESDGRFVLKLHSLDEGIEIIKSLEKSLTLTHEIVTAHDVRLHRVNKQEGPFKMYRFSSEEYGDALLYVRPEGAKGYDPHLEYGNNSGVEASIKFIVNPSDPHHLSVYKDPHGLSIRLDREGRTVEESPFSESRDPTRGEGAVSLDISAIAGDGRHVPVKVGRLVAAGNIIRAAKVGRAESLHHNTNHFDQQTYGSEQGFFGLANYTANMAEAMIEVQAREDRVSRRRNIPLDFPQAA